MKKILLVLVILVVLVVGALGVLIATFDANRFRPMITEKASAFLGAPVELENISLVWANGVALRATGLAVYGDERRTDKSLEVSSADVLVDIAPLLQKRIVVSSVRVTRPKAHLVKGSDGAVQIKGVKFPPAGPSPTASASGASPVGATPDLSISRIQIEKAEVRFQDASGASPMDLTVRAIDVDIRDFSLSAPFSVQIKASIFSDGQNLSAQTRVSLPTAGRAVVLEDLNLRTDLSELDLAAASKAIPQLAGSGLSQPLAGVLTLSSDKLSLDPAGLDSLKASLSLEDAKLKSSAVKGPIEDLDLSVALNGADVTAKKLSANFAGGTIKASGMVKEFRTRALSGFSWEFKDLAIDQLMPDQGGSQGPKLGGRLSLAFEGSAAGAAWPSISQTLTGRGQVSLRDGVLLDYNLLREVLNKLSMIPGAEEAIRTRLPGIYRAKMNEPGTILKPMDIPVRIQDGQVWLDSLALDTDFMALRGSGQVGLDQTVALRSVLLLDRDLSSTLVSLLPQIQLLTNAQGNIEIPVQIQGRLPRVMVLPDTDYITQKVIASKASELVTGLIENPEQSLNQMKGLLKQPAAAGESGVQAGADSMNSLQNLLGQALGEQPAKES